eukprot:6604683-Ditylum_brightwellii.AAC.1
MTGVPCLAFNNITKQTEINLSIFTIITNLGSVYCAWFANGVKKMFVASNQIYNLANTRGHVPNQKLAQTALALCIIHWSRLGAFIITA